MLHILILIILLTILTFNSVSQFSRFLKVPPIHTNKRQDFFYKWCVTLKKASCVFFLCALGTAPRWAGANPTGAGSTERQAWRLLQVSHTEHIREFIYTICSTFCKCPNENKVSQGILYVHSLFWAQMCVYPLLNCHVLSLKSIFNSNYLYYT